jgi:putative NADH-flavin reductase
MVKDPILHGYQYLFIFLQSLIEIMTTTIAVIGGTGKSGKYLTRELIERGFHLKMLLRDPEKFDLQSSSVECIKGDARDYRSIFSVTENCYAVISTLGQPQGEAPIFSTASSHIIQAMKERKIKRYILVTGLSIDVPLDSKGVKAAQASAYMRQYFPAIIADKQKEYEVLTTSKIDWTLVRVPLIEQTDRQGTIKVGLHDCPGEKISATDLAKFLVEQLDDLQYIQQSPFIASI